MKTGPLAEEYSNWQDSSRRIDLLCLDQNANLVVVELKRTADGGHMELQALRYAAMVASLTFDQAAEALAADRAHHGAPIDKNTARQEILAFLGWSEPDEERFARDTRILLAAAGFGVELTTAVLWLRDRGIDIRCIRLLLHRLADGRLLLDIDPLIPLPETADFQTRIGQKQQAEQQERSERHELRHAFWKQLLASARERTPLHAGRSANTNSWISGSIGRAGFQLIYGLRQQDNDVRIWIASDKAAFEALLADREAIEAEFGADLGWRIDPNTSRTAIEYVQPGGYRSPRAEWPDIQDNMINAMIRLDRIFRPRIQALPPS